MDGNIFRVCAVAHAAYKGRLVTENGYPPDTFQVKLLSQFDDDAMRVVCDDARLDVDDEKLLKDFGGFDL